MSMTPSSKNLLDKLAEIPPDILRDIGDELLETRITSFHQLFHYLNRLEFKVNREKVMALIEYLKTDLMNPSQPHYRKKGGLVGLAVLTIALTKKFASCLLHIILPPILDSFGDSDVSVCQYASETICSIAMLLNRS